MKRDPHLQDLSRDHHHALVLARRAVRAAVGSDEDVAAAWEAIGEAFAAELAPHFEVEERILLPALEACGAHELCRRTRRDHRRMRALLVPSGDARERLRSFGELLREHVRFEEAELFPVAEARLDTPQLAAIAAASAATPGARRRVEHHDVHGSQRVVGTSVEE